MDECATCVGFRAILVDASPPYQLVPAGTSWSILFTHTIGAFGHSVGTLVRTRKFLVRDSSTPSGDRPAAFVVVVVVRRPSDVDGERVR